METDLKVKKPLFKKMVLLKKNPLNALLPEKNLEVPVYNVDLSKDKKKDGGKLML